MLYLTCTTITSVDLAYYIVSHAKDWVSVDCGTKFIYVSRNKLHVSKYTKLFFFFFFFFLWGGGGGRLGAELREIEKAGVVN